MPLHFEQRSLRLAIVLVIFLIFGLQIWFQFLNRESFAALSAANLLLVEKVEKFDSDVAWASIDQTLQNAIVISQQAKQFDQDTRNRVANMNNWAASAARTADEVSKIDGKLDALTGRLELLAQSILADVDSAKKNTLVTREHADEAAHKLSQKVITASDVEALKKRADQLQQQNKLLRKGKAKPIFKLFLDHPTTYQER